MKRDQALASAAVVSILSLSASMTTQAGVPDQPKEWEKCAGIVKAGGNDCGSFDGAHGCAGQAKRDLDDNEWVYLPKGACAKIVGGVVKATKPAKK